MKQSPDRFNLWLELYQEALTGVCAAYDESTGPDFCAELASTIADAALDVCERKRESMRGRPAAE